MSLPKLTAQQSIGRAFGNYIALASPVENSGKVIETMMDMGDSTEEENEVESLKEYITQILPSMVLEQIQRYKKLGCQLPKGQTDPNKNVQFNQFPIGSERIVQGWIYAFLFRNFDVSNNGKYFCFLESKYDVGQLRSDVYLIHKDTEVNIVIEIKTDYEYEGIKNDIEKIEKIKKQEGKDIDAYIIFFKAEFTEVPIQDSTPKYIKLVPITYQPW